MAPPAGGERLFDPPRRSSEFIPSFIHSSRLLNVAATAFACAPRPLFARHGYINSLMRAPVRWMPDGGSTRYQNAAFRAVRGLPSLSPPTGQRLHAPGPRPQRECCGCARSFSQVTLAPNWAVAATPAILLALYVSLASVVFGLLALPLTGEVEHPQPACHRLACMQRPSAVAVNG